MDNDLDPPQHVQLAHMDATYSHVGELECFLVLGATNVDMPECDWFANPCCNETDTLNCGALLPNGATSPLNTSFLLRVLPMTFCILWIYVFGLA